MQANPEESSRLQSSLTLSYTESSKRLQRDQHKTWLKFWCEKNTCKATTWYMQFLRSYCIHKSFIWFRIILKVWKGHTKINIEPVQDFDVQNTTNKLQLDTGNLQRVIMFTRSSQMLPAWKFKKVIQRTRSNLVEILMSRTSLSVQLQHDAGKFCCIIIFTRSCKMLPFEQDLGQVTKKSGNGQHRTRPRFWCREYFCKITKWYSQFLQSYRVHKAAWLWASLKVQKGHTKVNV